MNKALSAPMLLLLVSCNVKHPPPSISIAEAMRQCEILEADPHQRAFVRCLVDRFGWNTDTALAVALRESARLDSLQEEERARAAARAESLIVAARAQEQAEAERRRLAAKEWVSHAVSNAVHSKEAFKIAYADPPPIEGSTEGGIYVGDSRNKLLLRAACYAAKRVPIESRRYFQYEADARAAGFRLPPVDDCDQSNGSP